MLKCVTHCVRRNPLCGLVGAISMAFATATCAQAPEGPGALVDFESQAVQAHVGGAHGPKPHVGGTHGAKPHVDKGNGPKPHVDMGNGPKPHAAHTLALAFDPPSPMETAGQETFRYDTFGDEDFWRGTLRLHDAIQGSSHGGVGPGVSASTALAVGMKVDAAALPSTLLSALQAGQVDLTSPETTLALLRLDAVVGVTGTFDSSGNLSSIGIQCALCHSTVDDSVAPGIGQRLDGWPNRDLNVGAIVNLSPDLSAVARLLGKDQPALRTVLQSWGPGKFDPELLADLMSL